MNVKESDKARSLDEGLVGAEHDLSPQWAAVLQTYIHPQEIFVYNLYSISIFAKMSSSAFVSIQFTLKD